MDSSSLVLDVFFLLGFVDELFQFRWAEVIKLTSGLDVEEVGRVDGVDSVGVDRDEETGDGQAD